MNVYECMCMSMCNEKNVEGWRDRETLALTKLPIVCRLGYEKGFGCCRCVANAS